MICSALTGDPACCVRHTRQPRARDISTCRPTEPAGPKTTGWICSRRHAPISRSVRAAACSRSPAIRARPNRSCECTHNGAHAHSSQRARWLASPTVRVVTIRTHKGREAFVHVQLFGQSTALIHHAVAARSRCRVSRAERARVFPVAPLLPFSGVLRLNKVTRVRRAYAEGSEPDQPDPKLAPSGAPQRNFATQHPCCKLCTDATPRRPQPAEQRAHGLASGSLAPMFTPSCKHTDLVPHFSDLHRL